MLAALRNLTYRHGPTALARAVAIDEWLKIE
jgi:hypothetical protein